MVKSHVKDMPVNALESAHVIPLCLGAKTWDL
jgi:hypothetical protein